MTCFLVLIGNFGFPISEYLAAVFGIDPDAPLRGQSGEYAFIGLLIGSLGALAGIGFSVGYIPVVLWLHFARGYPWPRVVRIVLHAEYPQHWLSQ